MATTGEQGSDSIIEIDSMEGPQTRTQQPIDHPLTEGRRLVALQSIPPWPTQCCICKVPVSTSRNFPSDLKEELQSIPPWPTECCIYKVSVSLRRINESAYTPKVVSIGPLHHGSTKLQPMEAHKRRYLNLLLRQNSNITLEGLVQVVRGLEERARNCYEEEFTRHLNRDQFVEIMLLDSCFILTFFHLWSGVYARDEHDPMFTVSQLGDHVYMDILLLENQLPFFILEQLYLFTFSSADPQAFLKTTFKYFKNYIQRNQFMHLSSLENHQVKHFVDLMLKCNLPSQTNQNPTNNDTNFIELPCASDLHKFGIKFRKGVKHFVDLMLKCTLPSQTNQNPTNNDTNFIELPSATDLHKCGIKFKKGINNNFLDIKFTNPVLEIPFLSVTDSTEQRFRNLIAMEQCYRSSYFHITDYTIIMDFLINTPDDVALLRSCGIIYNCLGSDEDVCRLFNNITKGVYSNPKDSRYIGIIEGVSAHCNRRWNLRMAHLKRDYFNSPWTIISLIAALVLLISTIVQAVCSVISANK
ncbi:hypothetical protein ACHQM5_029096 [Ranunculus cassubicifolius]